MKSISSLGGASRSYALRKKKSTNADAATIGCIVSIVTFAVLTLILRGYMLFALITFLKTIPLSVIVGAFIGKDLLETRKATWLLAVVGALVGLGFFFSSLPKMIFD